MFLVGVAEREKTVKAYALGCGLDAEQASRILDLVKAHPEAVCDTMDVSFKGLAPSVFEPIPWDQLKLSSDDIQQWLHA